ncbi:hypothetical protein C0Q70_16214 [Pomacea canaliculata]|uniref:Uncharacterized protein n=1 Tax=Pomacea canaliculata TaxID=400727 RepID=A0A2T7NP61_POMCA|nr:hypothetical protein C0Q70_16214 [Pomacea canaliculata]
MTCVLNPPAVESCICGKTKPPQLGDPDISSNYFLIPVGWIAISTRHGLTLLDTQLMPCPVLPAQVAQEMSHSSTRHPPLSIYYPPTLHASTQPPPPGTISAAAHAAPYRDPLLHVVEPHVELCQKLGDGGLTWSWMERL